MENITKILCSSNLAVSCAEARKAVLSGYVSVDGETIRDIDFKMESNGQEVKFGKRIIYFYVK
jgi:16S rRNA U516 pseudouridylate synthase RsuA-like enzyme